MVSSDRHAKINETLRQDVAKLKAEIRNLEKTAEKVAVHKDRLVADGRKMECKHADLKAELAKALESLNSNDLTSTHGKLLSENMELKKKVDHLQHKVESTERDAQFAREQYQTASNSIYEVRQENEELQSRCETLKRKADDNIVTLRQMNHHFGVSRRDDEIEQLKVQLKESEERVRRLELEKANTSRKGVLGTRSMSVPKRGSPAQSRASSPNVVPIAHPLRNRQEPSY
jgi:chromosome segregation ATPase